MKSQSLDTVVTDDGKKFKVSARQADTIPN